MGSVRSIALWTVALLCGGGGHYSEAAVLTFSDRAAFLAAVDGENSISIPTRNDVRSFAAGPLTFRAVNASPDGIYGRPSGNGFNFGGFVAMDGRENLNISATTSLYAFGFDVYEYGPGDAQLNATYANSTFSVETLSGGASGARLSSQSISPPDRIFAFLGFLSDTPFDFVKIRETAGNIENEHFGNFVISTSAQSVVPLPLSGLLLGTALAGLGMLRAKVGRRNSDA